MTTAQSYPSQQTTFGHERLDAYRVALEFLELAQTLTGQLPRAKGQLGDQLERASESILLWISKGRLSLTTSMGKRVATMKIGPQSEPHCLAHLSHHRGVVIEGYGDGNVSGNLVSAIKRLAKKSVVVLGTQCTYGGVAHRYEGGATLVKSGILSAGDMTTAMATVKLM